MPIGRRATPGRRAMTMTTRDRADEGEALLNLADRDLDAAYQQMAWWGAWRRAMPMLGEIISDLVA